MVARVKQADAAPAEPIKRAAVYLRISKDDEETGFGLRRQLDDAKKKIKARGWEPAGEYSETISAFDRDIVRPEYERLVADRDAGKFDIVVCWTLDRLSRQPNQLDDWLQFGERRPMLISTKDMDLDISQESSRFIVRQIAAAARYEVELKSARQKRAQLQRAKDGRPPKGVRPLGYTIKGEVMADEAKAVKAIFDAFAIGASERSIAAALSGRTGPNVAAVPQMPRHEWVLAEERREAGKKTKIKTSKDAPWSPSTVLGILRNPRYAGYSTYSPRTNMPNGGKRRNWPAAIMRDNAGEPIRGQWEPIIPLETWYLVQEKLNDPARITNHSGTDRKHLGSGLFICGECGSKVKSSGTRYRCDHGIPPNPANPVNRSLMRSRNQIDSLVISLIYHYLQQPEQTKIMIHQDEPRLTQITKEIEIQRGRISEAQSEWLADIIRSSDFKLKRDKAEAEIEKLQTERTKLASNDITNSILTDKSPAEAFLNADLATQRAVIAKLCTVTLKHGARGHKQLDPASIQIKWNE